MNLAAMGRAHMASQRTQGSALAIPAVTSALPQYAMIDSELLDLIVHYRAAIMLQAIPRRAPVRVSQRLRATLTNPSLAHVLKPDDPLRWVINFGTMRQGVIEDPEEPSAFDDILTCPDRLSRSINAALAEWPRRFGDRGVLQSARHGRAVHQGRQERHQVDAPVMPEIPQQRGSAPASCVRLQSRQLHADAGLAEGGGTLVADNATREVGEDRGESGQPWQVRHVPIGRGGGAEGIVPENPEPD